MPDGVIKFVKNEQGYGFIVPDAGGGDIYFKTESLGPPSSRPLLFPGSPVSFEIVENEKGDLVATQILAKDSTATTPAEATGRVKFWDSSRGFGFVEASDGQDLYLGKGKTIFDRQIEPQPDDQVLVSYVNVPNSNPVVTFLKISAAARWKSSGIPLFDSADLGVREAAVEALAHLAEQEDWDHRIAPTGKKPILDSYLRHTFARLQEEDKVQVSEDASHAALNTGLVTTQQEEIYALFGKNPAAGRQPWRLIGFRKKSDRTLLEHFGHCLPKLANYFDDPSVLLYDRRLDLHINIDHVLENLERFPEPLQHNNFLARQSIQAAEANTRARVYRNYKAAVPQWYRDRTGHSSVQLLLPLCLQRPDVADLALVVSRVGDSYRGNTVLTLDMAYKNARLIARPDSDWLHP